MLVLKLEKTGNFTFLRATIPSCVMQCVRGGQGEMFTAVLARHQQWGADEQVRDGKGVDFALVDPIDVDGHVRQDREGCHLDEVRHLLEDDVLFVRTSNSIVGC
jgi:hypothetical protein